MTPNSGYIYQKPGVIRVLLIGNSCDDRKVIEGMLNSRQFKLSFAPSETCPECIIKGNFDIILFLDINNSSGTGSLKRCIEQSLDFPTIIISDHINEGFQNIIGKGIQDYLFKGQFDDRTLRRSIVYAIERNKSREELLFKNNVLSEIKDSVIVMDNCQRIVYWNNAAEKLYDLKAETTVGKKLKESFFNGMSITSIFSEINSKGAWCGESVYVKGNGEEITVESKMTIMRDNNGKAVGIISVSRDVTERKNMEKDRFRLASFPEMSPNPIIDADFSGKILYVNPIASSLFPDVEANGNMHRFFSGWDSIVEIFRDEKTETISREINICGRWFLQQIHHIPKTSFIRIYAIDVTERKHVQRELEEKGQQLSLALESAKMAAWTLDPITDKMETIGSIVHIYGFPTTDFSHRSLEIVHPDDAEKYKALIKNAMIKGKPYHSEFRIIRPDTGKIAWLDEHAMPIKDEEGNIKMLAGVVQDVTESKQAEEETKKSLEEKEVLLKEVHHRVKNNLQMISSLLHLQSFLAKGKAYEMLKDSQSRVKSISLVHEILYQSKDFTNISSMQYFKELVSRIMNAYRSKNISVDMEVQDTPIKINTAITCGLIVNELVINSIKHAFSQGNGKICIYFNQDEANNILTIKDNGIGISKDFDFSKTNSLGLKLVKSLVGQLEGDIEFMGENGTAFKIAFPR